MRLREPVRYLAAMRIATSPRRRRHRRVEPVPARPDLRGAGWTTSPFEIYPTKGRHMWRDVEREAGYLGLAWRRPSAFPRHSVLAARVALVAIEDGTVEPFARDAFTAHFAHDQDLARDDVIDALLGADAARIRARAASPEIKQRLHAEVDRARALGMFGAPSFVVGDELFWGDDRLERALACAAARPIS